MSSSSKPQEPVPQTPEPQGSGLSIGYELEFTAVALPQDKPVPQQCQRFSEQLRRIAIDPSTLKSKDKVKEESEKVLNIVAEDMNNSLPIDISKSDHEHATAEELGQRNEKGYWDHYKTAHLCLDGSAARAKSNMPADFKAFPMEFASKVYLDIGALEKDLRLVCDFLTKKYAVSVKYGEGEYRGSTHIHIGSPSGGFDLICLKRIMALMRIWEPAIMSLIASWKKDYIRYCSLLREHSHLARIADKKEISPDFKRSENPKLQLADFDLESEEALRDYRAHVPEKWAHVLSPKIIWTAENVEVLACLGSSQFGERRPAFSFHGLAPGDSKWIYQTRKIPLGTIEVRYMHSSMDADDIIRWINLFIKIVGICQSYTDDEYKELLERSHAAQQQYGEDSRDGLLKTFNLTSLKFKPQKEIDKETTLDKSKPFEKLFVEVNKMDDNTAMVEDTDSVT